MIIDRLRIAGFKSFADPVEVAIGPGMTGIVGPNGCGKSNLIEAFRWAMGETSAKRMRAEGMDDVIFGGTDTRPPRSTCEVTVGVDASGGPSYPEFGGIGRIEVGRRLDRGEGSSYRVNGKQARARDVQVLFKDAGIGAGSSALVSQGKVGAIIAAKPSERRVVLEEAAGVTGLASRRHEAELRLKGTEQNLERAVDMERGLSEQVGSLRRQARQARRRKEIDGLIRAAEASAFLVRWRAAEARTGTASSAFDANEESVKLGLIGLRAAEAALLVAEESAAPAAKARSEAETAVALAKARVEGARKEANAARAALAAAARTAERTRADLDRETAAIGGAGEEYEELKDRKAIAEDDREYDAVLLEEAAAAAAEAKDLYDRAASEAAALAEALAAAKAERSAALRRRNEASARKAASAARVQAAAHRVEEAKRRLSALPSQDPETAHAEADLSAAEERERAAADSLQAAADRDALARLRSGEASVRLAAAIAEEAALAGDGRDEGTAGQAVVPDAGFEAAVAAALGEGLGAAVGGGEGRRWERSRASATPPRGTVPLADRAKAPPELRSALSGVGMAASRREAEDAAALLEPGQSVVTEDGGLWRWDGYRSDGSAEAAERMRRAARLREISVAKGDLDREASEAAAEASLASSELDAAKAESSAARAAVPKAREALAAARSKAEAVERERHALHASIVGGDEALAAAEASYEDDAAALEEAETALAALPDDGEGDARAEAARRSAAENSAAYESKRSALEKARRDAEGRVLLIQNIEQQLKDFDRRIAAARDHVAELRERLREAEEEGRRLAEAPELSPDAEVEAQAALEEALEALEAAVTESRKTEERVLSCRGASKEAEARLAGLREDRARLLAELKAARETAQELVREIGERMGCAPDGLHAAAGVEAGAELPDLQACEARMTRLVRERDGIGTVNLLAEEQLAEAEAKLGEAGKARDELREAVKRLRATIAEFDREARERLTEAFSLIDGHFRDLFTRLFGGGHAYLRLSGSDDILEAGLEIYASPPGKKLQAMSLMSGGEQALAALALVFAAFLIRPAPVCVLDEVDAPLDDANVDRLCSLVAEMAREKTRFLVVTHHALTMARCDRLYGVTMAERGVSRVAVLDMEQATAYAAA